MEMTPMTVERFEQIQALTRKIYEKRDELAYARTLAQKLAYKKEIQQLVDERTRLVQE